VNDDGGPKAAAREPHRQEESEVTVPNEPDKRVIRSTPTGSFVILPNVLVRDRRLSSRARGVLAELLSRPPERKLPSADEYATEYGEGRDAIRAAYRELERFGYLRRDRLRDPATGRTTTVLTVYDDPATNDGFPVPGVTSADTVNAQVVPTTRKPTVGEHVVKYLEDEVQKTKEEQVLTRVAVGAEVARASVPDVEEDIPDVPLPPSAPALPDVEELQELVEGKPVVPEERCPDCFARPDWGEDHFAFCRRYRPPEEDLVPTWANPNPLSLPALPDVPEPGVEYPMVDGVESFTDLLADCDDVENPLAWVLAAAVDDVYAEALQREGPG
jgi:hypothetical protein